MITEKRYEVDYSMLPEHMRDGAEDYVERGIQPGHFLLAVLCNNLVDAVGYADTANRDAIATWGSWLHNEAPAKCWGSKEAVRAWQEEHFR